jgi:hypothetical protein
MVARRTVAVVLRTLSRTGKGTYGPDNVRWIRRQVEKHVNCLHRFVALTDITVSGVDCIQLKNDWPGWYSKLELFSLLEPPCFYLDLDTVIVGDVTHLATCPHAFITTSFRSPKRNKPCVNTSIMAWNRDLSALPRLFKTAPEKFMAHHVSNESWVDQGFVQEHAYPDALFEEQFPGQILSFRNDLRQGDPTPDCRIVLFHGKPKPQDVKRQWIPTGQ